jgi:hypothetical protein
MPVPDRLPNAAEAETLTGLFNGVAPGLAAVLVHGDLPLSVHNKLFKDLHAALKTAIDATETTMGGGYRKRRSSRKNRKPCKARKSRRN